jgi:hypothetical protein
LETLVNTPAGNHNYQTITNDVNVYLIFWGTYWGTAKGTTQANNLRDISHIGSSMLGGSYLSQLTEYGGSGAALYTSTFIDSSSDPSATFNAGNAASAGEIQQEVATAIQTTNSLIGDPDLGATQQTAPIYVVITAPDHASSNGGFNAPGTYTPPTGGALPINMISVGTAPLAADSYTLTLSHEMAERMSDPTGNNNGVTVTPPNGLPTNLLGGFATGQIGDYEPEPPGQPHYGYRLPGLGLVQPYWSDHYGMFVVPDGNAIEVRLNTSASWTVSPDNSVANFDGTYSLLITANQLSDMNNTITVNSSDFGGTQVLIDGESFAFDPGLITTINIAGLSGTDTVNIEAVATNQQVNVFDPTGHNSGDPTNFIIGYANDSVQNILGTVNIEGFNNHITVDDSIDNSPRTVTLKTLGVNPVDNGQTTDTWGQISDLTPGKINYEYADTTSLTITTGLENDMIDVFATGTQTNLNKLNEGGRDILNLGMGNTSNLLAPIGLSSDPVYSAINVDDSASNTSAQTVILSTFQPGWGRIAGLAPINIDYAYNNFMSVTVQTSTGGGSLFAQGTGPLITYNVLANSSFYMFVGDLNGTLAQIQGSIYLHDPAGHCTVDVGASGERIAQAWTVQSITDPVDSDGDSDLMGSIFHPGSGSINFEYGDTTRVDLFTGIGAFSSLNVQATGMGTSLYVYTGNATWITVGNSGSVSGILGPVNLFCQSGKNTLLVDDSNEHTGRNHTHDKFTGPTDPDGDSDIMDQVSFDGLAPINYEDQDTVYPPTIKPDPGTATVVTILATGLGMNLVDNGPTTVNVGNAGSLAGIAGDLTISNTSGFTTLVLDDSADSTPRSVLITASSIQGYGFVVNYTAGQVSQIIINGGTGANLYTEQGIPAGTKIIINGGSGSNTLTGPNADTAWTITGSGSGTMGANTFAGITNLVGGSGVDTFQFGPNGSIGSINAGGGGDWLDYSLLTTAVTANLATGSATGVAGAVSNIQNVLGGAGNDTLTGNDQGGVLVGRGGTNVIAGGNGRSLLIGGAGIATITGGSGDDIIVGGSTSFDQDQPALASLLAEWQRTDKAYADRTQDLRYGGGYNGANKLLYQVTVQNTTGAHDVLTGGAGLDWFFQFPTDTITDLNNGGTEQVENSRLPTGNVGYAYGFGVQGGWAQGQSIITDAAGDVYTVGAFNGTINFNPGPGVNTLTSKGAGDTYVAKYSAQGQLLWLQQFYGSDPNWDVVSGDYLKVDGAGNLYVTGYFFGSATIGSFSFTQSTSARDYNHYDGFIAKLDNNGTVQWADHVTTTQLVSLNDLAVAANGTIFVSGAFVGTATLGTITLTSAGGRDGLVAKFNSAGTVVWARSLGGSGDDYAFGMSLDASGNLYSCGFFSGTTHFGSLSLTSVSTTSGFVAKLNSSGTFVWVRQLGTNLLNNATSVQVDAAGHVYVVGGLNFPDNISDAQDFYLASYTTGGTLQWTDQFNDTGHDCGSEAVAIDNAGGVYLTAFFAGTVNFGSTAVTSTGTHNVAMAKFSSTGAVAWVRQLSGTGDDYGYDLAVDPSLNIYTTGSFTNQADFEPGPDTCTLTSHNNPDNPALTDDAFLWQLTQPGPMSYTAPAGSGSASYDLRLHEGYVQLVDAASNTVLLSKAQVDTTAVTIKAANGVNTTLTIDYSGGAYSIPVTFTGGTGTNTLVGPNVWNNWTITAANAGKIGNVTFTKVANLVGGTNVDVFKFMASGSLSGNLDGGGAPVHQGDWLDYSSLTTAVTVNLQTGSATGVAGAVTNIQDVHGGNGGSTLTGNAQGNILIGGAGADTITGGSGLSLLIGDKGADNIIGGSGGDILIGDYTTYDSMGTANEKALMAILAEWQSGDSYANRVHDINTGTGGGLNGTAKLNFGITVKDDGSGDTLTAAVSGLALDWFFQGVGDSIFNTESGEARNNGFLP